MPEDALDGSGERGFSVVEEKDLPVEILSDPKEGEGSDTESRSETTEGEGSDTESRSETTEDSAGDDEVSRNLICLKNGDTESLVGISFGDEFDYSKYEICGWEGDGLWYYHLKGSDYGAIHLTFGGRGNGFSGMCQFGENDFFGLALGEDELERIVGVLGPPDTQEDKKAYDGTETWAAWNFEDATLYAMIKDGKIRTIKYFADGDVADVPEKPEAETDYGRDCGDTEGHVEAIYNWSAYGSESEGTYAILSSRGGTYEETPKDYDEAAKDEFLHSYLLAQGICKEEPDGVTYDQSGNPFVEYYVDREKEQYCFILHMYEDIFCTTYTLEEDGLFGHIIYEEDSEQNGRYERLYDRYGKKMAEVSYEYISGMLFPFVSQEWNLDTGFHPKLLIRNQKTWFYKERAGFDQEGKFYSYEGDTDEGEYLPYSCRTVYDGDGRLKAIQEELLKEDMEDGWGWWDESIDYSGQIEFFYRDDGTVSNVEYFRSSRTHGTTDSSGDILYDERGRMVCNDYYITHGGDTDIYLYEGDSDMPWCVLRWCCFMPGFEGVYLFLPQE